MYIRRDYNKPFFRAHKRQKRRKVWFGLLVIMAGLTFGILRFDLVQATAYNLLNPDLTPTPLPSTLAVQAEGRFLQGDLAGAIDLYQQALAMRPDSVDYLYEYGMLLIDLDNSRNTNAEEAREIAERMIAIAPNDARGYALRARALVWTNNASAAVPVATAGLGIAPDFAPLHAALSRAYISTGKLGDGQRSGLQAIEHGPSDVRSYWAYASSLANSGARDEAILEYERAVDVHPNFLPPYFELALQYLASNRDQEAIDTYDRILGVQPRNAQALLRQCEAYRKVGQFERARGLCRDAVTADPDYAAAQFRYGLLAYNDFEFSAAEQAFQACVNQENDNLACIYRLGLSRYYLARENFQFQCGDRSAPECQATEICRSGWELLQEALILAQAREGTDGDIEIIRVGLTAISSDPACRGVTGRQEFFSPATSVPTVAPEITPQAQP